MTQILVKAFNDLEGVKCNEADGAMWEDFSVK